MFIKGTPYEYLALKDIVTTFEQGKYYAVIGQTGSGKSTLIQHTRTTQTFTWLFRVNDVKLHKTKDKYLNKYENVWGSIPVSRITTFEDQ